MIPAELEYDAITGSEEQQADQRAERIREDREQRMDAQAREREETELLERAEWLLQRTRTYVLAYQQTHADSPTAYVERALLHDICEVGTRMQTLRRGL